MATDHAKPSRLADRRLELTMRDTFENLEDLALRAGYNASLGGMEILEVIPAGAYDPDAPLPEDETDNVIRLPAAQVEGQD